MAPPLHAICGVEGLHRTGRLLTDVSSCSLKSGGKYSVHAKDTLQTLCSLLITYGRFTQQ